VNHNTSGDAAVPDIVELERIAQAVADLDDIRDAAAAASMQPPASAPWWRAVQAARSGWADHCGQQEHGIIAQFQREADRCLRARLGSRHGWAPAGRLSWPPAGSPRPA
jgi:hypothetical protein